MELLLQRQTRDQSNEQRRKNERYTQRYSPFGMHVRARKYESVHFVNRPFFVSRPSKHEKRSLPQLDRQSVRHSVHRELMLVFRVQDQ